MRSLILLLPALAALSGCGGDDGDSTRTAAPRQLDTARVERAIAADIKQQRGVRATVSCPTGIRQSTGVNFVCTAQTADGATPFAVVQKDDAGQVSYTAAEPVDERP